MIQSIANLTLHNAAWLGQSASRCLSPCRINRDRLGPSQHLLFCQWCECPLASMACLLSRQHIRSFSIVDDGAIDDEELGYIILVPTRNSYRYLVPEYDLVLVQYSHNYMHTSKCVSHVPNMDRFALILAL